MKDKKVYGSQTSPKFKITIGGWYLEIGRQVAVYHTATELIDAIKGFRIVSTCGRCNRYLKDDEIICSKCNPK